MFWKLAYVSKESRNVNTAWNTTLYCSWNTEHITAHSYCQVQRMIQYRLAEILCQGKFSPNQVVVAKTFHQVYFLPICHCWNSPHQLTVFRTVTFLGGLYWYSDGFHWEVLTTYWPWSYLYAAGDILNCYMSKTIDAHNFYHWQIFPSMC